jgi:hypothetical protein
LQQCEKISEAGTQFEQCPFTLRGVSTDERGVVPPGEPIHAPSTPTAIRIVVGVEILVGELRVRLIVLWNISAH